MDFNDNCYGIRALQNKMLEILKCFISICEENGLTYWAAGGTCLGALRHGGFIPWDDDLDVYMPRQDYEKLWELFRNKTVNNKYVICRTTKEKNYRHRVMQMVDIDTTFINHRCINDDIEHGVYIDIIPLDARAKGKLAQIKQVYNSILFSVYNIEIVPEFHGARLPNLVIKCMLGAIKNKELRYRIWKNAESRMSNCPWDGKEEIISLLTTYKRLFMPMSNAWFEKRYAKFEDIDICIPNGAEEYCTQLYGNYKELPSEENRHPIHNTVFIDLDNSYLNYKGIYYCKGD